MCILFLWEIDKLLDEEHGVQLITARIVGLSISSLFDLYLYLSLQYSK